VTEADRRWGRPGDEWRPVSIEGGTHMRLPAWAVGVVLFVLAVAAWRLWPGEERRVRARLEAVAAELSIPPGEAGLARVTRAASVRAFFTDDVAIEVLGAAVQTIRGREEIAAYIARAPIPPQGTRVELLDVDVEMGPDRSTADVRVGVRIVTASPKDTPDVLDARMIALTLRKVAGAWLIANARVMPTDDSLAVR